jgi:hypothetical protein
VRDNAHMLKDGPHLWTGQFNHEEVPKAASLMRIEDSKLLRGNRPEPHILVPSQLLDP